MIRLLIWLIPVVLLGWLGYQDAMVSGRLSGEYNFDQPSPYVLSLAPRSRITEVKREGGDSYQAMIDDPIYFDVRLPRPVDNITLTLRYRAPAEQAINLAAFYNKDEWRYETLTWSAVSAPDAAGWRTATATVAMNDKRFAWQKYQFMISLPGVRTGGPPVDITQIQMTATRAPLTIDRVWSKIKRTMHL